MISPLYHADSGALGDDAIAFGMLDQLVGFQRGTLSSSGNNGGSFDTVASSTDSQTWDVDPLGNWHSSWDDGTSTSDSVAPDNELTAVGGSSLVYDDAGNTATDEDGQDYVYDAWGRQVLAKDDDDNPIAAYAYNGTGERIEETHGGTTRDLYYSPGWQVLEERQGGDTKDQYVWSAAYVNGLVLRDADAGTGGDLGVNGSGLDQRLYAQQDANYDVTALIDTSGAVVERYEYEPYGDVTVLNADGSERGTSSYAWDYLHQGGRPRTAPDRDSDGRVPSENGLPAVPDSAATWRRYERW